MPHEKLDLLISIWYWRRFYCPYRSGSSSLAFECTQKSPLHCCQLCIKVGGHTLEHLLEIGKNDNFFRIRHWFCLISSLSQPDFDGDWHCKDARLTYSFFALVLPITSGSLVIEFFHALYILRFEFFPGDQLSWWRFSLVFFSMYNKVMVWYLKRGHQRFHMLIHHSSV